MSALTLWLPTKEGGMFSGQSTLYVIEIDTPFLPRAEDMIHILRSEEEGWTVGAYVHHVYWDLDGKAHATLQEYVVDPRDDFRPHRAQAAWRTSIDGPLHPRLLESGWKKYRP